MTVLLCGIPSEEPLAAVAVQLQHLGVSYATLNQREFEDIELEACFSARVTGQLRLNTNVYRLEDFCGVYTRLMDDRFLPEIQEAPDNSALRHRCRALHDLLGVWQEVAQCRVVNRPGASSSNISKPYQSQLAMEHGFLVPETLVTNDPALVIAFRAAHRRVVYKSISGVRSIVSELVEDDDRRLDDILWCPVQFQEYVPGYDIRVHVIDQRAFATEVLSDATDYRYANRQGQPAPSLQAIKLPDQIEGQCIAITSALKLAFSGIDLRVTPSGDYYFLEANTCPAFTYYENQTGQPIGAAVAAFLAGI